MSLSRRIVASPIWHDRELIVDAPGGSVSYDGRNINLHSPTPLWGETDEPGDCHVLPGGNCYTDGSGLAARDVKATWMAADQDDSVIWAVLERWTASQFGAEGAS